MKTKQSLATPLENNLVRLLLFGLVTTLLLALIVKTLTDGETAVLDY